MEEVAQKNDVEVLIDKINHIRQALPPPEPVQEDEKAFDEAAEEYYLLNSRQRVKR